MPQDRRLRESQPSFFVPLNLHRKPNPKNKNIRTIEVFERCFEQKAPAEERLAAGAFCFCFSCPTPLLTSLLRLLKACFIPFFACVGRIFTLGRGFSPFFGLIMRAKMIGRMRADAGTLFCRKALRRQKIRAKEKF